MTMGSGKMILKLALAATAMAGFPVLAGAQQMSADARGDWRGRGGEMRGDARVERQQRPEQPRPAPQNVGQNADARRGFQAERRDDRRDFRQERTDDRRDLRDGSLSRPQFDANRRDARNDFRADRRDDRRDFRNDRRDDRRDFRGDSWRSDRNQWNQGFGRSGFDDRRNWNRGWRSDNRYAWNDYRAANRGLYRLPRYYAPSGWGYGYRRFGIGFTLNAILFGQNYWIDDPYAYRLPDAYGPYRWVRYYNDALLVDLETGRVVDTVYDIFW